MPLKETQVSVVVGKPLLMPKIEGEPAPEVVEEWLQKYCDEVQALFQRYVQSSLLPSPLSPSFSLSSFHMCFVCEGSDVSLTHLRFSFLSPPPPPRWTGTNTSTPSPTNLLLSPRRTRRREGGREGGREGRVGLIFSC